MLIGQDAAKIDAKKRAPENAREYDQIDYYEGIHIQHHYIKLRYFELSNCCPAVQFDDWADRSLLDLRGSGSVAVSASRIWPKALLAAKTCGSIFYDSCPPR